MSSPATDRSRIAWLYRRAAFGLAPGQLDELAAKGVDRALDELLDPDGHGVPAAPDPWAGMDLAGDLDGQAGRQRARAFVGAWIVHMATTPRPLDEWVRWFWHGHFVSTLRVVKVPALMAEQLRLLGRLGQGQLAPLVKAVTIDPAMLIYLDGRTNRKGRINENYGRELLELFTLGIGHYTEADVRAGAEALSGWRIDRETGTARFVAREHDDTPHQYLGVDGVHDLDGVVRAVTAHEACAPFIAGKLCRAILGPDVDAGLVARLAGQFRDDGLAVAPLLRRILEAGLDGASTPMVWAPLPWFVAMVRANGLDMARVVGPAADQLIAAGQVPMDAPNVAGWPGGTAWLTSATTLARATLAGGVAGFAGDGPVVAAAARRDWAALASAVGRPEGFAPGTVAALEGIAAGRSSARVAATVAMAAPDVVVA